MPRRIVQIRLNIPQGFRHNINNNNPDQHYTFGRNQLYRMAFLRFSLIYARVFSGTQRKVMEFLVLLMALFSFVSLIYVHIVFVQSPVLCLQNYQKEWEQAKILRVEILRKNGYSNYSLYDSYYKEHATKLLEAGMKPCPKVQHLQADTINENVTVVEKPEYKEETVEVVDLISCRLNKTAEEKSIFDNVAKDIASKFIFYSNEEMNIMEYSMEYGFLRLSPAMRKSLNISVLFVALDLDEDTCIGGKFNKFILNHFLGYDNLLLSSVRHLAEKNGYKGFVRNVRKEVEYIFIEDHGWLRSYVISAVMMLIVTFSVSLLLRFSHQQLFFAIATLVEATQHRRSYNGTLLLTVILALFGLQAIIVSFFHDSTLTLNILLIVWLADFYDSICCRALMAKRHWYRFFLLYHFVFYAYNNRFNGLHWQLNLWTSWLFNLHSMLFFFHHYELPYYVRSFDDFRDAHRLRRRPPPPVPAISPSTPPEPSNDATVSYVERDMATQTSDLQDTPGHVLPNETLTESVTENHPEESSCQAQSKVEMSSDLSARPAVEGESSNELGSVSSFAETALNDPLDQENSDYHEFSDTHVFTQRTEQIRQSDLEVDSDSCATHISGDSLGVNCTRQ